MKSNIIFLVLAFALSQSTSIVAKDTELTSTGDLHAKLEPAIEHDHEQSSTEAEALVDDDHANSAADKSEHNHSRSGQSNKSHDAAEGGVVELSQESIQAAGVKVTELTMQSLNEVVSAPGEVQLNQYSSAEVTPLIDAVVVERHARLGDSVEASQRLVTLVSIDVAQAQGQLRVAAGEWQRARKLGSSAVGAKRYTEAEVAYEQARLTLSAYGLDAKQIDQAATQAFKGSLGQFHLSAPLPGTILRDDFRIGQRIEAGQKLFLIADESQIWIKANLSPVQAQSIRVGVGVRVNMGGHWHDGKVIQKHHLLDEGTRTVPIRISVTPDGEHHHAGEFVAVSIDLSSPENSSHGPHSLVVPESGLMQDDAQNWTVFIQEQSGHFRQRIINRGMTRGSLVAISGIPEGTRVVTDGAFFLASELAKSGFDIHDH